MLDLILKENLIIIKNTRHSLNDFLGIAGLARVVPCTILFRKDFIKPNPKKPRIDADGNPIDSNTDSASNSTTNSATNSASNSRSNSATNSYCSFSESQSDIETDTDSELETLKDPNTTRTLKKPNSRQKYTSKRNGWVDDRDDPNNHKRGLKKKRMTPEEKALKDFQNDDYLKSVISIIVGMISKALEGKGISLFSFFLVVYFFIYIFRNDPISINSPLCVIESLLSVV